MTATAAQIARVRRMVNEPTEATYTDDDIQEAIERYPLIDERGEEPYTWDTSTQPPTQDANEDWVATYDLHAAAADIWEEKAAAPAQDFDVSGDGASMSRGQVYEHYMAQARYYRARRAPRTMRAHMYPQETGVGYNATRWSLDASAVVNRLARED